MCESLKDNPFIKSLDLSSNHLECKGAKSVAKMIQYQAKLFQANSNETCLEELKLCHNSISTEGFIQLFNALSPKTTSKLQTKQRLKVLEVGANKLCEEAGKYLVKMIETNDCLT